MDFFNFTIYEMLARTAAQERFDNRFRQAPEPPKRQNPVKRVLASSLVRLGLRLDPAAGEGLANLGLSLAKTEARS